jgi:MFS family permease
MTEARSTQDRAAGAGIGHSRTAARSVRRWVEKTFFELGREFRWSYLPPLMVYLAAGVSGLTGIAGTFFVKEYLSLSAAFLASLGFWVGIPWALKMPVGHLVDLIWRWKALLVFLGAGLIAASLLIMVGLVADPAAMAETMPIEAWYVVSALLAPIGYVIQDAVADAMTVEAVPAYERDGTPVDPERRKLMHTTMQTLGRVAIISGTVIVALINLHVFAGAEALPTPEKARLYQRVYLLALVIPLLSVLGVIIAYFMQRSERRRLVALGVAADPEPDARARPNWWILGGGVLFVAFTVSVGLAGWRWSQEIIFAGSMIIVGAIVARLTRELDETARQTLLGTAIVIFVFRAVPGPGAAVEWWMIDELGFDPGFFSILSLTASALTLAGMFVFRRFMAEHSIAYVVGFLTICAAVLSLPQLGMYYGLHHAAERATGGIVDARFIALVNTALESPLGQIAMIPMLAWIARSAPARLKATYFAVMASFTNLALSLSQLGTKYLNEIFTVSRAARDPVTGGLVTAADYSELGELLLVQLLILLVLPFAAIVIVRATGMRSA